MNDDKKVGVIRQVLANCLSAVSVDGSFALALANYANHQGVASLDEEDLTVVLESVVTKAIALASDDNDDCLDGRSVTSALIYGFGCDQGMGNCHNAASMILGRDVLGTPSTPREIEQLPSIATADRPVDQSFLTALVNYSQHHGVRNLIDDKRLSVLDTLARESILGSGSIADGRSVTEALIVRFGCSKAMGECHKAAEKILGAAVDLDFDVDLLERTPLPPLVR